MSAKSEIDALKEVDEALGAIDEDARKRVLAWANAKYLGITVDDSSLDEDQTPPPAAKKKKQKKTAKKKQKGAKKSKTTYKLIKDLNLRPKGKKSAVDFVAEKNPTNMKQKCVVALYWVLNVLELQHELTPVF